MNRISQAFGDKTPLHGEVTVVVKRGEFIHAPAHAAVVDDDLAVFISRERIHRGSRPVPKAETQKTDDYIVGTDNRFVVADADAVTGCRLSRNGEITVIDF